MTPPSDGTPSSATAGQPGELPYLDGFVQLGIVGYGSSAEVYRARNTTFDDEVALKVWRRPLDPEERQRFLRECALHRRLSGHPNIVGFLWADAPGAGPAWIATELCEQSLEARLRRPQGLSGDQALALADDILSGLAEIHRQGHVHRDVKPSNVLLRQGRAMLCDLGIAQPLGRHTLNAPAGTAGYLAPELGRGQQPDHRSDVYSAAVTLFEVLDRHLNAPLELLLTRASSTLPADRPADAAVFLTQLRQATGDAAVASSQYAGPITATATSPDAAQAPAGEPPPVPGTSAFHSAPTSSNGHRDLAQVPVLLGSPSHPAVPAPGRARRRRRALVTGAGVLAFVAAGATAIVLQGPRTVIAAPPTGTSPPVATAAPVTSGGTVSLRPTATGSPSGLDTAAGPSATGSGTGTGAPASVATGAPAGQSAGPTTGAPAATRAATTVPGSTGGAAAATTAAAAPKAAPAAAGKQLQSLYSSTCMDVRGPSTANGTAIQLWDCINVPEERWTLTSDGHVTGFGGKCLAVRGPASTDQTPVELDDCAGVSAQNWTLRSNGNLVGYGGMCLDVYGPSTANGTPLQMWSCNGAAEEGWRFY
ncbi:ricin-type beta-trefoil lectin protein [Streptomyces sp. 846.5]|nr:serine/threonine protein kinase [Streptomyces sp. 846.5]TDU01661.1 ricin-type beta-trefoil lectin protein [Streptomyces sp. 846.5]